MRKCKLDYRKDEILSMFNSGISPTEIARTLGEYKQTVYNLIRKNRPDVKFSPDKGNQEYFSTIDSYAKAYIVGFIAADGALIKTKTTTALTITIKYEDREVLDFIKSEIGNTHNLLEIRRPSSYNPEKEIHHIRYAISSPSITRDLMALGIGYNKSLAMGNIINNIPEQFRDAFIIGYFDGDGSVTVRDGLYPNDRGVLCKDYSLYIQIRGTQEFLEGICEHLGITKSHIHQNDSIPHLSFANKKDVARLFQCYNGLPFYYKRKYNRFLQRINHPSFAKYRQVQTISSSGN